MSPHAYLDVAEWGPEGSDMLAPVSRLNPYLVTLICGHPYKQFTSLEL